LFYFIYFYLLLFTCAKMWPVVEQQEFGRKLRSLVVYHETSSCHMKHSKRLRSSLLMHDSKRLRKRL